MYRLSYFNRYCTSQKLSDVNGKFFENFVCLEVALEIFVPLTWTEFVYP